MSIQDKLDWFIPDNVKEQEDVFARARQLIIFCLLGPLFFIPNIVKWVGFGGTMMVVSMVIVMCLILMFPFVLKMSKNYAFSANWVLVCLMWQFSFAPLITGGFYSSSKTWVIFIPVLAIAFIGLKSLTFWMIAALAEIIGLYVLDKSGVVFENLFKNQAEMNSTELPNIIGPLLAVGILLFFMARARNQLYIQQKEALKKQDDSVNSMTNMVESIKNTIETIGNVSGNLMNATTEMSDSTEIMSDNTAKVTKATENTTRMIEEMNQTANNVSEEVSFSAKSISDSSETKKEIGTETQNVSNSINSVSESLQKIDAALKSISNDAHTGTAVSQEASQQAEATSRIIDALGTSTKEINEVMDLIKEIASQTSLLALNANIEAAGAGDAGKGFAIVANEVKELSRQTAVAADNINSKVDSMHSNNDQAVEAINRIVKVIVELNSIMTATASSLNDQTQTLADISGVMKNTANSAGAMTTNIKNMINLDVQNSQAIEKISVAAVRIAEHTEKAKEDTLGVYRHIQDVSLASDVASKNTVEVRNQAEALEKLVSSLSQLVKEIDQR